MRIVCFFSGILFTISTVMAQQPVKLITLDPGHFHAALVQKSMYPQVDPTVHVYAKKGIDLQMHLDKINGYNGDAKSPTHWKEVVYEGDDYLDKMLKEKKGNVVVLAGNNQLKTDYILKSVQSGYNVFSDKPMVINEKGFNQLKQAFTTAQNYNLLLYVMRSLPFYKEHCRCSHPFSVHFKKEPLISLQLLKKVFTIFISMFQVQY